MRFHSKLKFSLFAFLIPLFFHFPIIAQEPLRPLRTETPPKIDGVLEDSVWQAAPSITGLKTFIPDFGLDMSEKTIVYMAYDRENLFFAFKCFDREPDKIKASVSGRDTIRPDDWICINLDSFNDHQSLTAFYVNPLGIQGDSSFSGGNEDHSTDLVWYSAGRIEEDGYSIEVRIPLKSLRFSNKKNVEMSVLFERRISRRSEQGMYPALNPDQGYAFMTQMKPLIYEDVKHYTLLEILPAFTFNQRYSDVQGDLQSEKTAKDISLTAKYGLSSKLILDATVNPDFSQVESDAGQVDVNLRYDLFFVEKRPFFLEGHEYFNFGGASELLPSVVHTRTIIDPSAGVKLSGKLGNNNTFASIFAIDESSKYSGSIDDPGNSAIFSIFRYKRALKQDSYIGAFYTGRDLESRYNRVIGPDGQIRLTQSSQLGFHLLHSETKAAGSNPSFSGNSFSLAYSRDTRNLLTTLTVQSISRDFATQVGFLTRTGITSVSGAIQPHFYPDGKLVRKFSPMLLIHQARDHFDNLAEMNNQLVFNWLLFKNFNAAFALNYSNEVFLSQKFNTSGLSLTLRSQFTKELYLLFNLNSGHAIYYSADPYQGNGSRILFNIIFQPMDKLKTESSLRFSNFFRKSDDQKIYDYTILRQKTTYQFNKYLFFRGIVEYNTYRKRLLLDMLASFTYIPGTVIQLGYGSLYEKLRWEEGEYRTDNRFLEMQRGLFFKVSYLWRL